MNGLMNKWTDLWIAGGSDEWRNGLTGGSTDRADRKLQCRLRSGRSCDGWWPWPAGAAYGWGLDGLRAGKKRGMPEHALHRERISVEFPVLSLILYLPAGQKASGINVDA